MDHSGEHRVRPGTVELGVVARIRRWYERSTLNVLDGYLAQGALAMATYLVFFLWYDAYGMRWLAATAGAGMLAFAGGVALNRAGRGHAAGLVSQVAPMVIVVVYSSAFSWIAGVHLLLLVGASSTFVILQKERRVVRVVLVSATVAIFAGVQVFMVPATAWYPLPGSIDQTLFTLNAISVVALLYVMSAVVHQREARAYQLADLAANHARELARTDALTGLANRRPAIERLGELSQPGIEQFSLAIVDFDHFKVLNDEYGHMCGDRVLTTIGHELSRNVRHSDLIARWGGEEFLILLPNTNIDDAAELMERVRHSVDHVAVYCPDHMHHVTVSIGVGAGSTEGTDAIRRADAALYEAKEAGRNKVRTRAAAG